MLSSIGTSLRKRVMSAKEEKVRFALVSLVICLLPSSLFAQSSWGVVVSGTPSWKVPDRNKFYFDADENTVAGSEFTIGIARGQTLKGDWGISFTRMPIKDGSSLTSLTVDCATFSNGCFTSGSTQLTRSVVLNGVKVSKFISFGTIKQRVQIGLNIAGGVGKFAGDLETHNYSAEFGTFNPQTGKPTGRQLDNVTTESASTLFASEWAPIGDVQGAVSFILAPGVKVRAASGIGWPGDHTFTLTGVYLFGRR